MSNQEDPFITIASKVNAVILEKEKRGGNKTNDSAAAAAATSTLGGARLDLWQPRDWPHRKGDEIRLNLHSYPLDDTSPGRRPHPCEKCSQECSDIHNSVLCWKCKGSYCIFCLMPHAACLEFLQSMESILKDGYGKCPSCQEPLRAIAVTEDLRKVIEPISNTQIRHFGLGTATLQGDEANSSIHEMFNHCNPARLGSKQGQSLVQEAEQALQRARSLRDNWRSGTNKVKTGKNMIKAIDEYTHVINAITYFASLSNGGGLILRPHDLLLIAHYERAILEGNKKIADAMSASYPKASVRSHDGEKQVSLSMHAFQSLFYPLPAVMLVGSPQQSSPPSNGLVCFDLRTELKERAFEFSKTKEQISLVGGISNQQQFMEEHPDCDGMDNYYSNLQGSWKGTLSYSCNMSPTSMAPNMTLAPLLKVEEENLHIARFVQFVRVFPTATAAAEYTRIIFETKTIGEEAPPISAQNCRRLAKIVKKKTKQLLTVSSHAHETTATTRPSHREAETIELSHVHVLQGELITSCVATIGHVSTKILVVSSGGDQPLCVLLARVFVHLHKQLESCMAAIVPFNNRLVMDDAKIFHRADFTLCAYCGKDDASLTAAGKLKGCSRCHCAKYCCVDCQRNHWNTQGSNSHKPLCKLAKKQLKASAPPLG